MNAIIFFIKRERKRVLYEKKMNVNAYAYAFHSFSEHFNIQTLNIYLYIDKNIVHINVCTNLI